MLTVPPGESSGGTYRQCDQCLWHLGSTRQCLAFPKAIPAEIWNGEFDHSKPYPGDKGYQFVHVEPRLRPKPSS